MFLEIPMADGAPSMGVADVAPSDSTIEVVHRMSKFNIFIISYLLLSLLHVVAGCYCSLSCRQMLLIIALTPTGYCSLSFRQLLLIIVLTLAGKLLLNIAFCPADNYRMLLF